jgi:hypothetical protein
VVRSSSKEREKDDTEDCDSFFVSCFCLCGIVNGLSDFEIKIGSTDKRWSNTTRIVVVGWSHVTTSDFYFEYSFFPHIIMSRAKNWCFTLNNYTDDDCLKLSSPLEGVSYCIFGKEVGENGTPHLQGFIQFVERCRLNKVKDVVGVRAHLEVAKNVLASIQYCKKDGDFVENGDFVSSQGDRSDLERFKDDVKSGVLDLKRLREDHSDVFAKYTRFCLSYVEDNYPGRVVADHPLRDWQQSLKQQLDQPPCDRKIIFIVDRVGNTGKSWFSHWWCQKNENSQLIQPGKFLDMAYCLRQDIRVLFCDAPRSKQGEFLQYDLFEHVKNGSLFSGKYESRTKSFGPCHVVIMMNELPDMTKLSADRYHIIDLDGPPIILN